MAAASIITSIVTAGTNNHATVSEEANGIATDFISQGIVNSIGNTNGVAPATGGFGVSQDTVPDMGVTVNLGVAYVSGTPSSQGSQMLRARMTSNYTAYTINANASGSTKYDWIYLQFSAANAATPSAAADNVITLYTSRSSSNVSDNGTPPTYGLLLAVVTVTNGASSIVNANIADKRVQSAIIQSAASASGGWTPLGANLTYSANNGNKEFVVTAPSDLTGTIGPGMKLRIPRGVTPPTQSMSFTAASSQYATKASPTGITFTSALTVETWIYLNSYSSQMILTRTDASANNGWYFKLNATGQVEIDYASGGSTTNFVSYQSLPLRQWTHIAASVSSTSSKTATLYINGNSVASSSGVTAAATITQSGNLIIGSFGSPSGQYLDAYISELRLWSVAQSQASIQANMAINLVGNETNLVALFQGNGNFNDATSNANNLTPTNGPIATQAANPYSATEYATVIAASYSNPTTTLTLDTGTQNTIPNQTLGSVSYSYLSTPVGLPLNLLNYTRYVQLTNTFTPAGSSLTQINGLTITLTIPSGSRRVELTVYSKSVASGNSQSSVTLWEGAVSSGLQLQESDVGGSQALGNTPVTLSYSYVPLAGSRTYNVGYTGPTSTSFTAGATAPAFLLVKVI